MIESIKNKRMLNIDELCDYIGLGRSMAADFAKQINAMQKVGRRNLYDRYVIDRYFDEQAEMRKNGKSK